MTSVGKVQTVLGPIDSQALGVTLTHEHMLLDATPFSMLPMEASARGAYYRDPYARAMFDVSAAIEEVNLYKQYGGASLVECTPIDLARDPWGWHASPGPRASMSSWGPRTTSRIPTRTTWTAGPKTTSCRRSSAT